MFASGLVVALACWWFHNRYTLTLQSPIRLHFQSPIVVSERVISGDAAEAQADQHGHRLSAWQQYACRKFGPDCRLALAIQRAENPQGKCEIYHYNSDGTLDWGYFQINTVHLKRPGLNLRDLLDCKANIDFAYQLYREKGGFTAWSTFNNGAYRQFMSQWECNETFLARGRLLAVWDTSNLKHLSEGKIYASGAGQRMLPWLSWRSGFTNIIKQRGMTLAEAAMALGIK